MGAGKEMCIRLYPGRWLKSSWFTPACVAALFIFFAGVLYVPWGSEAAPAWVQAIGSVVAILIAIAIPAWQRRQDEERRLDEAKRELEARMRVEYQNALMGLRACIEVDQFLAELIKRSGGNRFGWHDKSHFQAWISGLQQRLSSLIDAEQNAEWWGMFLDAKRLLLDIDSALRKHDIDDAVISVLARTTMESWEERVSPARDYLREIEDKHKDVLRDNIWH